VSSGGQTGGRLLGIDGGNTKTIALVARSDGTVVGTGRITACSDPYAVGMPAALEVIMAAADAALATAGGAGTPVRAAAFSLAGADWPEDKTEFRAAFASRWPDPRVVNDAIGALRAGIPVGPGVAVAVGTGAATGARGVDTATWHTSFWQEPQGARELGVKTLQAVYRAELGLDPPTALTQRVLERVGERSVEEVLRRATTRGPDRWREPAVLAPILLDAAEAGDPTALALVTEHGRALGRYALVAARRVGIAHLPFELALTGGVLRHPGRLLRDAVVQAVREGAPQVRPVEPALEPAAGALLLAFDAIDLVVDGEVERRLLDSLPPDTLFDTHAGDAALDAG
jgi:N-acetylglucosamine kinase-like BadF-type ATPase